MVLIVLLGLAGVAALALVAVLVLHSGLGVLRAVAPGRSSRFFLLVLQRNLLRNFPRTALTVCAVALLVVVVLAVWAVLQTLDRSTQEQAEDLKYVVRARYNIPSEMPLGYITRLEDVCRDLPEASRPHPDDTMSWQMYLGTVDPVRRAREDFVLCFALEPRKALTMMDVLEGLPPDQERDFRAAVARMEATRNGVIVGRRRLQLLNKRVGERFRVTSTNHPGIDLEFEIVGLFPPGRYEPTAIINRDYLNAALRDFQERMGKPHPMASRTVSLFWVRLPSREAADILASHVEDPARFASPPLVMEAPSSGVAVFVEGYRDLIWSLRWVFVPAVLAGMALLAATTMSITVRERDTEMALLKAIGYTPAHVAVMVVGEAVLVGLTSGFTCAASVYLFVNHALNGIRLSEPMVDFAALFVPVDVLWWGPAIGGGTALVGSLVPAWSACRLKVATVLGRVR
jgi:putative ABC transport system permease protein